MIVGEEETEGENEIEIGRCYARRSGDEKPREFVRFAAIDA